MKNQTSSSTLEVGELKLNPSPGPLAIVLREIFVWSVALFTAALFSLFLLKDLFSSGVSKFLDSFHPKAPSTPPAHLYQKQPNSDKNWNHKEIYVNGVNYHYVEEGDPSNQTMLFLHGFPEFWYSWRHQLVHFSKSYRVIAIDMKGYGDSDKPQALSAYSSECLAQDLGDLVVELQKTSTAPNKKIILVGHDWGGIISWWLSICYGKRLIDRLVILNCQHTVAFAQNATLVRKIISSYMYFLALPYFPELVLNRNNFAFIKQCFLSQRIGLVHKERFTKEDEEMHVWAFSRPGSLTATLNYYRNLVRGVRIDLSGKTDVPTVVIWGEKDGLMNKSILNGLEHWVPGGLTIKFVSDAGHWVQQDAPEQVNELLEEWLNTTGPK